MKTNDISRTPVFNGVKILKGDPKGAATKEPIKTFKNVRFKKIAATKLLRERIFF